MNFFKKKQKPIELIDFSMQHVSTGQVEKMLKYLETHYYIFNLKVVFGKDEYGMSRCYLSIDDPNGRVIRWFKDRNPAQVEELAKTFY